MTENEIIKKLESCYKTMSVYIGSSEECRKHNDAISKAIDAVKEIQQYRLIGTVEECREAAERQNNGKWIPCSERLPEKVDRYYIVSVKSTVSGFEYTRPALYDKYGFATRIDEEPIAWIPLPKSYKPD